MLVLHPCPIPAETLLSDDRDAFRAWSALAGRPGGQRAAISTLSSTRYEAALAARGVALLRQPERDAARVRPDRRRLRAGSRRLRQSATSIRSSDHRHMNAAYGRLALAALFAMLAPRSPSLRRPSRAGRAGASVRDARAPSRPGRREHQPAGREPRDRRAPRRRPKRTRRDGCADGRGRPPPTGATRLRPTATCRPRLLALRRRRTRAARSRRSLPPALSGHPRDADRHRRQLLRPARRPGAARRRLRTCSTPSRRPPPCPSDAAAALRLRPVLRRATATSTPPASSRSCSTRPRAGRARAAGLAARATASSTPSAPASNPTGSTAEAEVLARPRSPPRRGCAALFRAADVFVFTFGLTEAWIHRASGTVYPTAPGHHRRRLRSGGLRLPQLRRGRGARRLRGASARRSRRSTPACASSSPSRRCR